MHKGILAACCVLACASTTVFAGPLPSDAEITHMLQVRVDLQKAATGIVVGIAEPTGNRIVAYGTRGLKDKTPVSGDTVYDIGSITKVFTALLLADMVQRHDVALDEPVQELLPAGRVTIPTYEGKQISLADLATQTSGLPLRPANLVSKDPDNKYAGYTVADLYAFLSSYRLTRAPGSQYEYSNVGFGLLGIALSAHAKMTYADLVQSRITVPLGVNDTRIVPTADMVRREALPYDMDLKPAEHGDEGALLGAGALRSTANDLLKLLDVALGSKGLPLRLAFNSMVAMRRPGGMQPATAIALGWNIFDDGGREIVWKNGSVGGYRAFAGYNKKARLGIVALANAQTGAGVDDIGLHLLDPAIPVDLEVPKSHIEISLGVDILDQFVGRYRFSPTDMLTVGRRAGHLYIIPAPDQPPIEIFAEGPRNFFLKVVNAQVRFGGVKNSHATRAVWHQSGQDQTGERVK
ncbi:MAG TPA: serine hydrolase [Rhizomicrobium sp.]